MMNAMGFAGKRVTIMGVGFFGGTIGLAKYLVAQGAQVTLTDLKSVSVVKGGQVLETQEYLAKQAIF